MVNNIIQQLASGVSSTDVKELIPEFFYLPDFLRNVNGYEFGKKQDGEVCNIGPFLVGSKP
jgi:hypothetical protein